MNAAIHIPNMARLIDVRAPRLRRPVPDCWETLQAPAPALAWISDGLKVLASCDRIEDQTWWLHVSLSRGRRLPSWEELRNVKELFIGRQHVAVQVFPADRDYINLHPYCFHLWSPEES